MTALSALLLIMAGATLIYLASARQGLRPQALPAAARVIGWAVVVAGTALWLHADGAGAGITAALSTLMCTWVLLPYAAWWRATRKETPAP